MGEQNGASAEEPTLRNILEHDSLKWIFVGGKGGVGKTTCSCSLAVQLAAARRNVLIISTDPAHNLSDAFRQKFTSTPSPVTGFDNLFAMEVDPNPENARLTAGDDESSFLTDLAGSIPGIDEAMSFAEVMRQVKTMNYDCIVFDTAPTGHTLRLLQFPATLEKGLSKLMQLRGTFGGAISQIGALLGANVDEMQNQLLGRLEELKTTVEEVNAQFQDPELTTFVCVCIPEFLSLYETERLVQELAKFDIDCCNIVINQIIFEQDTGGSTLLAARIKMQQKYLEQFEDLYEDFHLVRMPLIEEEVRGLESIQHFSENLMYPYQPSEDRKSSKVEELEAENARLRSREINSHLRMVYDPVRAYWEQPPPWKVAVGLGVSVAVSSAFYQWWQQKYSARRPITVTPAWEVASWLRSWNKEREAGPPVILNPLRKNVPPYIRNLEDVEKLSEGKLKIPKDWPYKF
ncbi:g4822 [Coccomyxa viridis]|uniref:G4822 protein n=1 Tax=Coccomyxa viridis TaxID=1274662 RepID=A0ABP1FTV4_9CHLO